MAERVSAPLIVTADLAPSDFAWLDGLRRAHYPPDRNRVPAHLTLFHHLPPSLLPELRDRLRAECRGPAPAALARRFVTFDRGVALLIDSPALEEIRARLADAFAPLLTPQDRAGWRPHVTIQNKAAHGAAAALAASLARGFTSRPLDLAGLALWAYRNGPWESLARYPFSRSARFRRN